MTPEQLNEARAALDRVDQAIANCPANKRHLGDRLCPKCRAGPGDQCGNISSAEHGVVIALRTILQEHPNG